VAGLLLSQIPESEALDPKYFYPVLVAMAIFLLLLARRTEVT
jgi:hypothetical protein